MPTVYPYIRLFFDKTEAIDIMSDDQAGRLLKALMHYGRDGATPSLSGIEAFAFAMIKPQIDADYAKCIGRSEIASANGKKGGRPRKNVSISDDATDNFVYSENQNKPIAFSENQTKANANLKSHNNNKDKDKDKDNNNNKDNDNNDIEKGVGFVIVNDDLDNIADMSNALTYVQANLAGMTDGNIEELKAMLNEGVADELIRRAVDIAGANCKLNWAYIRGIIRNYQNAGIKTVAQAIAREESRKASSSSPQRKTKTVTEQAYGQREYEDDADRLPASMIEEMRKNGYEVATS